LLFEIVTKEEEKQKQKKVKADFWAPARAATGRAVPARLT